MIFWDKKIKVGNVIKCLFICDMCKAECFIGKYDLKRKKSEYCKKCYKKSETYKESVLKRSTKKPIIEKSCPCGLKFYTKNNRKIYCSEKCRHKCTNKTPEKKEVRCECGNIFYRRQGGDKYCSLKCPIRTTTFQCQGCSIYITERTKEFNKRKYRYCIGCYMKSPEKAKSAEEAAKNRPSYNGENNPNYRGKTEILCACGNKFHKRISPSQIGTSVHKYCSMECKKKYSVSISKILEYKTHKMRSSWEVSLAKYFDSKGYSWKYEPESFKTSIGFYTPDFWVEELQSYVEVKGYFRDKDAKTKFEEFSKNNAIILANKEYFLSLGFIGIKSGPLKGQFICP